MTEILTESFCERCGTRYTFESAVPSQRRLTGLKVLGRGLKNFVMSDDASLDEAMSAARSDVDRDATNHQLDAFHRTFSFCMSCRQYTCANCWNETEARCLSCEPLAIDLAAGAGPDIDIDIDPARLLRLMGLGNGARPDHEHVDAVVPAEHEHAHEPAEAPSLAMSEQFVGRAEAPAEHEDIEAPAAAVQDAWPTPPAAPVAWPEGFVGSAAPEDEPGAALAASADSVDNPAVDVAPTLADASAEAPAETAPVEWWARAELLAEHQSVAAETPDLPVSPSAPIASRPEVAAAEPMAGEPEAMAELEIAAGGPVAAEPEVATLEPVAESARLSDALAEYEAAFSAPIPEPDITEASSLAPGEDRSQAAAADLPAADLPAADLPAAELPIQALPIPALEALAAPILSESEPQAVVEATPAAEIAEPDEPVAATAATAPDAPAAPTAEPPAPTDHVAQPVWRAPADPARPAPQWPTGPRWPTGLPTGGAPSPLPPPVDALAALMARTSTEAMWAASSQEILQPASAAPAIAAIQSCGNCGISLSATARFCRRCGTPQG